MKKRPKFSTRLRLVPMLLFIGVAVWLISSRQAPADVFVENLRCEYRKDPAGIDVPKPRFSWQEISGGKNQKQTAYQLVVEGQWDSGRVESDRSTGVEYNGMPLKPGAIYSWNVRLWDAEGKPTQWSKPATFSTGLGEWHGRWIGLDLPRPLQPYNTSGLTWVTAKGKKLGPLVLSKRVDLPAQRKVEKAVLVLFPDNTCSARMNGQPAGEAVRWDRTAVLDVTRSVRPGANTVSLTVANSDGLPATVIGRLALKFDSGADLDLPIDGSWGDVEVSKSTPWGTPSLNDHPRLPASYLRKEFPVAREVRRATASVAALGTYELRLNGKRVGEDVLAPGWTDFSKRVYYHTYDVTSLLHQGPNAVAAILGDGWYASTLGFTGKRNFYGGNPRLKIELTMEYTDGSVENVITDGSWKASTGPIQFAEILLGCSYDARLAMPGWDNAGFDSGKWLPVVEGVQLKSEPLVQAAVADSPRIQELLDTVKVTEPVPGVAIFDVGQNMSGWARLKIHGAAGLGITVRYGEFLNPDGTLYTANLRGATSTDRFTLDGRGEEILEPSFTFHGFRYVELRGLTEKPEPAMVTGVVVHSPIERTGYFECSSPLVNQLFHNIVWGQKSNYIDVPTDCPQRDERAGWTGDAEFFIPTAAYNFNVDRFFTKWLTTLCEDSQHPDGSIAHVAPDLGVGSGATAWGDAAVICAYNTWRTYDDTAVIRAHYPALKRFMDWFGSKATNLIPNVGGFGDWLGQGGGASREVIDTAYYAYDAQLMAEMAQAIGDNKAETKYAKLHDDLKSAFAGFFDPDGTLRGCSQTGYVLAFSMGLVPDALREKAAGKFAGEIKRFHDHLATGFIGTPRLLPALHIAGLDDLAYRLLLQETYPSWLYQVKLGATTMWERWDGWTPKNGFQSVGMNSFNHYAFGSVGEYLYANILGIRAATPGYKTIRIQPVPGAGLTWANGSVGTIHGRIASGWKLDGTSFTLEVTIPPNTAATIVVPGENATSPGLLPSPATQKGQTIFSLGSGSYRFHSELKL